MTLPGDRPRNPHLARDVRLLEAYGRENVFWDSGGRWLQLRSFRIRSPQYRYNMDTTYVILMVPSDYGERAGIGAGLEEFYVHGALRVWHGEDWVSVPHMFDDYDPRGGQAIDMNHQYACCHVNWDPRKHNVLHSLTALALYFSDPWAFEREGPR